MSKNCSGSMRRVLELLRDPENLDSRLYVDGRPIEEFEFDFRSSDIIEVVNEFFTPVATFKHGVFRFVDSEVETYSDSFGFQWNEFDRTQLDSFSGLDISSGRMRRSFGEIYDALEGALVLDLGCGAGRFAEIAKAAGAIVVAVDMSSAIYACKQNLLGESDIFFIQGDIFKLPFKLSSFDIVYSLGVIQHTPDPRECLRIISGLTKPTGQFVVDVYEKNLRSLCHYKYFLRPITVNIEHVKLLNMIKIAVRFSLPIYALLRWFRFPASVVRRLFPVQIYNDQFELSDRQQYEWAVLDSLDWYAPKYDSPLSIKEVRIVLMSLRLAKFEIKRGDHLVIRGKLH